MAEGRVGKTRELMRRWEEERAHGEEESERECEGAGERVPILAQSRRLQNERRYYALVA